MRNFQDTFEIRKRSFISAINYFRISGGRFLKNLAGFVKSVFRFGLLPYCQRNKPFLFIAITLESIVCFKRNF